MKRRLYNGPYGSGATTFDSAVNEVVRTASWGSSTLEGAKNDGIDEGSYAEDEDSE